ncbi:MAG: hypothetical protein EGQ82_08590 [Clostridiales bacterium]|nr:hypothetical protein [Clostridiales bacterium]
MNPEETAKPKKKRHVGLAVFLCIVLLLLAVLGGIAWRYRAGIAVLIDNVGKTPEQASAEQADYERRTQELLDKLSGGGVTLSTLSEADRARLKNGEITPAEAVAIIMGLAATTAPVTADTTLPPDGSDPAVTTVPVDPVGPDTPVGPVGPDTPATSGTSGATEPAAFTGTTAPAVTTAPAASTVSPAVQQIIADIYLLRAEFINKLDALIEEGTAEVNAIPKEKRTASVKLEFMNRYLDRGEALEAECDARLEALLSDMTAQLKADGGDLSLVEDARALYIQEKKIRKAELYRKYVGT